MKEKIVKLLNCYIARSLIKRFSYLSNLQQFNNLTIEQFQPGQALVILLVFVATATIITSAAVTVTIINARSTGTLAQGVEALAVAEAGAEDAILRILRDPLNNYAGATIPVGNGTATIVVAGTTTKTITSTGQVGSFTRKIQVVGTFSNNIFTPTAYTEIN